MADGVGAAKGISTHNNTSSDHNRQSGGKTAVSGTAAGTGAEYSGKRQSSAVNASFSLSNKAVEEQELRSSLNMLKETNRRIKDESGASSANMEETRTVPYVLGFTMGMAVARIKGSGLKISRISRQSNPGVPDGNVITQVPGPGTAAKPDDGVHIIVSSGPGA